MNIEITCPECKSVLEYTYEDINRREANDLFYFHARVERYIICPMCKRDIDITPQATMQETEND